MIRPQSLFHVQFPTSAPVCQVDDFPRGTARSVDGALHIRPGGTKKITKTELDHLKKIKPWGKLIRVIKKSTPPPPVSADKNGKPLSEDDAKAARERQAATKAAKAKELAAKAAKTSKSGATKGGKPKQVADKDGKPVE